MAYKFQTSKERSALMSKIISNNTKPEVVLKKRLWGSGVRFCRKETGLPGKPDIVIKKYKIALFVDGEFWHGYNWNKKKQSIKANRGYWIPKIERNIERDRKNTLLLKRRGWRVMRFWQREIDNNLDKCIMKVVKAIDRQRKTEKNT